MKYLRIVIITMDDPSFTVDFIKDIIRARKKDIAGLVLARGDRMRIGKKRSKLVYAMSLFLIMGPVFFLRNLHTRLIYSVRKKLPISLQSSEKLPLSEFANEYGIETISVSDLNEEVTLRWIQSRRPDLIIHQSQNIVGKELLSIPSIGVLNRHNALLPKNRGRLTPFWVLYRKERETGVSIHWVTEKIDDGDVVYQERFAVSDKETFSSLVHKNYCVAPKAMLHAIELISKGEMKQIINDRSNSSYNSIPTFSDALSFRLQRIGLRRK